MQIQGKVAIVTGGGSGLGRATAEALVRAGAKVAVWDLKGAAAAAEALGGGTLGCDADVADEASVRVALQHTVERFGAVHACINCAGIASAARLVGRDGPHDLALFERVIRVNLIGTFNVMRLAAAEMARNDPDTGGERGVVINTASVAAYDGQVGQCAYASSKAAVVGMTLPAARDLGSLGIRVNTIAPGVFETPMMAGMPDEVREPLIAMVQAPKRLGDPAEFAALALQMIENGYLNGETVRLDGGIRMQPR